MKRPQHAQGRARGGFTLLEASVATSIFGIVGYGLVLSVGVGQESQQNILQSSIANKKLRQSGLQISRELRSAAASRLQVGQDDLGQATLEFQMPVTDPGGNLTWGVYDRRLGPNEDDQNRPDWSVRYVVQDDALLGGGAAPLGAGQPNRRLVREVLDAGDDVQFSETLVEGLKDAGGAHPGFEIQPNGDMWTVSISLAGPDGESQGHQVEFDVWTHN